MLSVLITSGLSLNLYLSHGTFQRTKDIVQLHIVSTKLNCIKAFSQKKTKSGSLYNFHVWAI